MDDLLDCKKIRIVGNDSCRTRHSTGISIEARCRRCGLRRRARAGSSSSRGKQKAIHALFALQVAYCRASMWPNRLMPRVLHHHYRYHQSWHPFIALFLILFHHGKLNRRLVEVAWRPSHSRLVFTWWIWERLPMKDWLTSNETLCWHWSTVCLTFLLLSLCCLSIYLSIS